MRSIHFHVQALCLVLVLCWAVPARAGLLGLGLWYQFNQNGRDLAQGCPPGDPFAPECFGSSGTPTLFANRPVWYVESRVPLQLTVVDAFVSGDRLDVFTGLLMDEFVGSTSAPRYGAFEDCGDDPVPCLSSAAHSRGRFLLQPDSTGTVFIGFRESVDDELPFGSAYFRIDAAPLPLPSSLLLALLPLVALLLTRPRGRARR